MGDRATSPVTDAAPHQAGRTGRGLLRSFRSSVGIGVGVLGLAGAVLAGCSSESGTTSASAPESTEVVSEVVVPDSATIIDVRTPEEYAEGHLEGAVNLDVQSGRFEEELESLDPDAAYVVYCRTGNRSAAAVATMEASGFTDVTDLGGFDDAATSTGIDIVS
jgi:phage shock protein E